MVYQMSHSVTLVQTPRKNHLHYQQKYLWLTESSDKARQKKELAQYLSSSLLGPAPSTLRRAIRQKRFTSWLGLTTQLITKHLNKPLVTVKGHLNQEAKKTTAYKG